MPTATKKPNRLISAESIPAPFDDVVVVSPDEELVSVGIERGAGVLLSSCAAIESLAPSPVFVDVPSLGLSSPSSDFDSPP